MLHSSRGGNVSMLQARGDWTARSASTQRRISWPS